MSDLLDEGGLHGDQGGEIADGDIVGDRRKLQVFAINPNTGEDSSIVGYAWQGQDGVLEGSGAVAAMLAEPVAASFFQIGSIASDVSPLSMLYAAIARNAFFRAEFVEA